MIYCVCGHFWRTHFLGVCLELYDGAGEFNNWRWRLPVVAVDEFVLFIINPSPLFSFFIFFVVLLFTLLPGGDLIYCRQILFLLCEKLFAI